MTSLSDPPCIIEHELCVENDVWNAKIHLLLQNGDQFFLFSELRIFSLKSGKNILFAIGNMTQYRLSEWAKRNPDYYTYQRANKEGADHNVQMCMPLLPFCYSRKTNTPGRGINWF